MRDEADFILQDIREHYSKVSIEPKILRLYMPPSESAQQQEPHSRAFAYFHQRLNELLQFLFEKKSVNNHFNAHESRELISLIREIEEFREDMRRAGISFQLQSDYADLLAQCSGFLEASGGSLIPEDLETLRLERYKPIFETMHDRIRKTQATRPFELKMIGEGAYSIVYKYKDEDYGFFVALKRAKRDLDAKDIERFRGEYDILRKLRFPYIVEVYKYNTQDNSYTMEYCESTLREFIASTNQALSYASRKRIGLQFLYGINYLHFNKIFHRDISLNNVLLRKYDNNAVIVKLSDFGLHKSQDSTLTSTDSDRKGTIIDPTLTSFRDYSARNDIYAIGFVLSYIFTGRKEPVLEGPVGAIVKRCISLDLTERYGQVADIIRDLEKIPVHSIGTSTATT